MLKVAVVSNNEMSICILFIYRILFLVLHDIIQSRAVWKEVGFLAPPSRAKKTWMTWRACKAALSNKRNTYLDLDPNRLPLIHIE